MYRLHGGERDLRFSPFRQMLFLTSHHPESYHKSLPKHPRKLQQRTWPFDFSLARFITSPFLCIKVGSAVTVKMDPPKLVPPGTNSSKNMDPRNLFHCKIWTPSEKFGPLQVRCRNDFFLMNMDPPELFLWKYGLSLPFSCTLSHSEVT